MLEKILVHVFDERNEDPLSMRWWYKREKRSNAHCIKHMHGFGKQRKESNRIETTLTFGQNYNTYSMCNDNDDDDIDFKR